ncbi:sporulation initiation phosphotransferase B [Neobacillus niacini]|uniref:sporulation initiation phosphotransferase B n=1 Tax=Neobacillus niacini TaxID=86668 RepID=UPI0021CB23C0|nr:sporulation initiation phosphotransferase B [Neobacillus niacini]MCM3765431.1 sporulation initiation phosphotransferase B [Neobacillus niacini]
MEKEWDIIEVLRHSRHDWLNKLQLIKANLDLGRIDRAKKVIDEIVIETQHETKLSNLSLPKFAALLLKTNWENHSFRLEYEVFQDSEYIKIDDGSLADWTKSFFNCLDQAIEAFQENDLSITIEPQSNGIRFFFDFRGIISNNQLMETFMASSVINAEVKELSDSELALEVFMPVM